jgi:hypothetical protein
MKWQKPGCTGGESLYFASFYVCSTAGYTKLLITAGSPSSGTKTEIVNMANGIICSNMADFPVELYGSVGANLDGTPVVCGGYSYRYSEKCYRFTNGVWEEYAYMKETRSGAAGVIYNQKLHVFGGHDGYSTLQTSETINVDGVVSNGPDLPIALYWQAMTSINDTVSILSGGLTNTNSYSAKSLFYNHDTEVFTNGPDLLEVRSFHGSATIVDKVTKAKIAVVTGGYNNDYTMDSTEMLINGQWKIGTI